MTDRASPLNPVAPEDSATHDEGSQRTSDTLLPAEGGELPSVGSSSSLTLHQEATSSDPLRVFPRRRYGQLAPPVRGTDQPVVLTLETLSAQFHLPLMQAARVLGICPTSVKTACRKFGVDRWPYRRGKHNDPPAPALNTLDQGEPQMDQESAAPGGAPAPFDLLHPRPVPVLGTPFWGAAAPHAPASHVSPELQTSSMPPSRHEPQPAPQAQALQHTAHRQMWQPTFPEHPGHRVAAPTSLWSMTAADDYDVPASTRARGSSATAAASMGSGAAGDLSRGGYADAEASLSVPRRAYRSQGGQAGGPLATPASSSPRSLTVFTTEARLAERDSAEEGRYTATSADSAESDFADSADSDAESAWYNFPELNHTEQAGAGFDLAFLTDDDG